MQDGTERKGESRKTNVEWSKIIENKSESFKIAEAKQIAECVTLNFEIPKTRGKKQGFLEDFKVAHPELNDQIENTPPISFMGQTFRVTNYLELYFSHSNTVFSDNSKQRFYF